MTIKTLIKKLKKYPENMKIVVSGDDGILDIKSIHKGKVIPNYYRKGEHIYLHNALWLKGKEKEVLEIF